MRSRGRRDGRLRSPLAPGRTPFRRRPGRVRAEAARGAARRVVPERGREKERRVDHQSSRGEWRVLCNHGAEPRADKPNQKR